MHSTPHNTGTSQTNFKQTMVFQDFFFFEVGIKRIDSCWPLPFAYSNGEQPNLFPSPIIYANMSFRFVFLDAWLRDLRIIMLHHAVPIPIWYENVFCSSTCIKNRILKRSTETKRIELSVKTSWNEPKVGITQRSADNKHIRTATLLKILMHFEKFARMQNFNNGLFSMISREEGNLWNLIAFSNLFFIQFTFIAVIYFVVNFSLWISCINPSPNVHEFQEIITKPCSIFLYLRDSMKPLPSKPTSDLMN